jgi:hypothetical protein
MKMSFRRIYTIKAGVLFQGAESTGLALCINQRKKKIHISMDY